MTAATWVAATDEIVTLELDLGTHPQIIADHCHSTIGALVRQLSSTGYSATARRLADSVTAVRAEGGDL